MGEQLPDRLESWKEIGAYLQRDARTVRRWEKEEGLPIHRHGHKRGASVYAYPSEIDAWRQSRKMAPEPPRPRPLWKIPAFAATMLLCLIMVGNGLRPQTASAQAAAPVNRLIWTLPKDGEASGPVSRDGRFIPYIDWSKTGNGNLFLHDLVTGTDRKLTDTATDGKPGTAEEFAESPVLSRDGTKVAYAWDLQVPDRFELRVLDLKAAGIPKSRTLYDPADANSYIYPDDWSPDGKWIAAQLLRPDQTRAIGVVNVAQGTFRVLKSIGWNKSNRMVFSPDGKLLAFDLPATDDSENRDIFALAVDGTSEVTLVKHPSHDTLLGWSPDGKRLIFASDRGGSMGVWAQAVSDSRPQGQAELVKPDVGSSWRSMGMTDAGALFSFAGDQETVLNIQTATIDLTTGKLTSPPEDPVATHVGSNTMPVWSPDGKYLAYQSRRSTVGMDRFVIGIRSEDTGAIREIEPTPNFLEIRELEWTPDGKSFLVTGYGNRKGLGVYQVDAQTGKGRVLVADSLFVGLMGAGGRKLYFMRQWTDPDGRNLHRAVMEKDLASGEERELGRGRDLSSLQMSPDGKWLTLGLVPIANAKPMVPEIVAFPTSGGEPRVLLKADGAQRVQVIAWMPDSRSVLINRVLDGQTIERWMVPVDGATPTKLAAGKSSEIFASRPFRLHPDGKRIAFGVSAQRKPSEVWALENFLPNGSGTK